MHVCACLTETVCEVRSPGPEHPGRPARLGMAPAVAWAAALAAPDLPGRGGACVPDPNEVAWRCSFSGGGLMREYVEDLQGSVAGHREDFGSWEVAGDYGVLWRSTGRSLPPGLGLQWWQRPWPPRSQSPADAAASLALLRRRARPNTSDSGILSSERNIHG